jgi:hypothetical protein
MYSKLEVGIGFASAVLNLAERDNEEGLVP